MSRRNLLLSIIGVMIIVCVSIGVSYSSWLVSYDQTDMNLVQSSCFDLQLVHEQDEIFLEHAYPMLNQEGMTLVPYRFTIINVCDTLASYQVNLEVLSDSTLPLNYVASMVNHEEIKILGTLPQATTYLNQSLESRVLHQGTLGAKDSVDYTLRLWMHESVTAEDEDSMNALLKTKVMIEAKSLFTPVEAGITKLSDAIFVNEYQTNDINVAKEQIQKKQAVDFNYTAPIITWQEQHDVSLDETVAVMPHPDFVFQNNMSLEDSYVMFGKGYELDQNTGKYRLLQTFLTDPTTLSYEDAIYYCESGSEFFEGGEVEVYQNYENCSTIMKVVSASKEEGEFEYSDEEIYPTIEYTLQGYFYSQKELESDTSDKGLYQAEDDTGITYYYRGSVSNNYVFFADSYWRILRVNGNGSIRLLYAGTTLPTNYKILERAAFQLSNKNVGYIGYMFGNLDSPDFLQVHQNLTDSEIKKKLDAWYDATIIHQGLSSYIEDGGFCNDRSVVREEGNTIIYGSYERNFLNKMPSLKCPNTKDDLFTTALSSFGNQSLTYPIGLMSVDELSYAGVRTDVVNKLNFVFSENAFFTMSPYHFYGNTSSVRFWILNANGVLSYSYAATKQGIRPVINLSREVEISSGVGTLGDPYIVKTW